MNNAGFLLAKRVYILIARHSMNGAGLIYQQKYGEDLRTLHGRKCTSHMEFFEICIYTGNENRWLAIRRKWQFVRGYDQPIHGSCAIYFPGGIDFAPPNIVALPSYP